MRTCGQARLSLMYVGFVRQSGPQGSIIPASADRLKTVLPMSGCTHCAARCCFANRSRFASRPSPETSVELLHETSNSSHCAQSSEPPTYHEGPLSSLHNTRQLRPELSRSTMHASSKTGGLQGPRAPSLESKRQLWHPSNICSLQSTG
jgi:hypothetical protein